ncbi:gamma-glutamyltransferase [Botrimarina sp.]|uniref:gamma-glutamyltransferase family protein n=1 Tax=Botrimarina sp. TaxID=2795802 RepID=UPI0032EB8493
MPKPVSQPAIAAAAACALAWAAAWQPAWAESVGAQRWAIATGHPTATAAGLAVLRDGGTAIDAAVAASLTLGVAEPYGSGLGGKLVLLYYDAASAEVTCVEALCESPEGLDAESFTDLPSSARKYGYQAVAVPGLPAGLHAAHQRWGAKPWAELVRPAERLAREGILVDETMRGLWSPHQKDLAADAQAARLYLVDGQTPPVGARLPNPELAETLARYAAGGADGFYTGETARRIVAAAQAAGSPLTLGDFADYRAEFVEPLSVNYHGYRVYSSPPPLTGGVTVLAALRAAELAGAPLPSERNAAYIDRFGRLLRAIYPPVTRNVADTPDAMAYCRRLLADEALKRLADFAQQIDPAEEDLDAPFVDEATLDDAPAAGTTHLTVIDSQGNMASLTQSLSLHFGAAVVPPGTGVLLNDSLSNFATNWTASPNYAGAAKRARSTVAPVIATRDGLPALAMGLPGGQRIPTMTLQIVADCLGAGAPLGEAFARPRFHLRRPTSSKQPENLIDLEEGAAEGELRRVRAALADLGWQTSLKPATGLYFGGGNGVMVLGRDRLMAVADDRRTNHAAGD